MHRHTLIFVQALLATCAVAMSGCTTPAQTPAESRERAVQWMIDNQNPDGSWGTIDASRPYQIYLDTQASHDAFGEATSALGVMSLIEPSRTNPAAEAALRLGVKHLLDTPPVGKATGNTFYDIWTHTYMLSAMCRLVDDERFAGDRDRIAEVLRKELEILKDRQSIDGGWGYYDFAYILEHPSGEQSTSFNTASVLLALDEARDLGFEVDIDMVNDGISTVERMRLPSGAYVYGTYAQYRPQAPYNMVKGSLGRSQPCNLALHEWGRDISVGQMATGVETLMRDHHYIEIGRGRKIPHEAYYSTSGYYYFYGHYYAGRVIEELDEPQRTRLATWLRDLLIEVQDAPGSWFDYPLYGYGHSYATAYALLAMQSCDRVLDVEQETPAVSLQVPGDESN
ncbi:MAG: hypothetical protein CMJ36_04440 [Phycisphaerae bacterium]|nr:hypothetical protein [Phycisphaerae bacterium]